MILKDVSDASGVSISVVSRVCNSKYVQTNYGTYPLKWFFSHKTVQADGDEISARRVMAALKELIRNEDKHAPLSDERLTQLLVQQGFHIARRTVAKYREQMGLPVARMRR
jgi:RNA polymerase sigma-54 factor